MILYNLFESYATLCPDEFEIHPQGAHGFLLKASTGMRGNYIDSDNPCADEIRIAVYKDKSIPFSLGALDEAKLDKYLRERIKDRGWEYEIYGNSINRAFTNFCVVSTGDYSVGIQNKGDLINLLTAYLEVLAGVRPIIAGKWQHFKGNIVNIVCLASWNSVAYFETHKKDAVFYGKFSLEEDPSRGIDLFKEKENWFYVSEFAIDLADRVFYVHDHLKYARKKDVFLGLVNSTHPAHEGKLRFAATPNSNA